MTLPARTALGDLQRYAVGVAQLREVPALRPVGVRCAGDPLGRRRIERQAAAL
jgi:hypothetical protein